MPKIKQLTASEAQILQSASQIFSGMVASGKVTKKNVRAKMDAAINGAIYLYKKINKIDNATISKPITEGGDEVPFPW